MQSSTLPIGIQVFERGWLSANSVLLSGRHGHTLVDSGYVSHVPQTLALVRQALGGARLERLLNTHLHSDHCGGNAALQQQLPDLETWVPADNLAAVQIWDEALLSYQSTGQSCPRFRATDGLAAGSTLALGDAVWEAHAAPGHDPAMLMLFEPASATLLSADALWPNGIGVIFPELEGQPGFEPMARTLDAIEALQPRLVIPGHGATFTDVAAALAIARQRLEGFAAQPLRHARFAAKVLLKFKLLEWQAIQPGALLAWAQEIRYLRLLQVRITGSDEGFPDWLDALVGELEASGAARCDDNGTIHNA